MSQSKQQQILRKNWDRWIGVVQAVESRHQGKISSGRYNALYQKLLKACDSQESEDTRASALPEKLRAKMRKIVEPWVSLETLLHSDRRILQDVLRQSEEINHFVHPHLIQVPRKLGYVLVILFAAGLLMGLHWMFAVGTDIEDSIRGSLERLLRRLKYDVARITLTQWLGVVAALVVLMGASLAYGTRKS